jgi:hypothetical protein
MNMPDKSRLRAATALVSGLIFALGLGISGMTDPARVLAFLDIAGAWNPNLALVMAAGIAVVLPVHRLLLGRKAPLFNHEFHWPTRSDIDRPLLLGAVLFGIGWGIAGLCPGPALVGLAGGQTSMFVFVAAMSAGMLAHHELMASGAELQAISADRVTLLRGCSWAIRPARARGQAHDQQH